MCSPWRLHLGREHNQNYLYIVRRGWRFIFSRLVWTKIAQLTTCVSSVCCVDDWAHDCFNSLSHCQFISGEELLAFLFLNNHYLSLTESGVRGRKLQESLVELCALTFINTRCTHTHTHKHWLRILDECYSNERSCMRHRRPHSREVAAAWFGHIFVRILHAAVNIYLVQQFPRAFSPLL